MASREAPLRTSGGSFFFARILCILRGRPKHCTPHFDGAAARGWQPAQGGSRTAPSTARNGSYVPLSKSCPPRVALKCLGAPPRKQWQTRWASHLTRASGAFPTDSIPIRLEVVVFDLIEYVLDGLELRFTRVFFFARVDGGAGRRARREASVARVVDIDVALIVHVDCVQVVQSDPRRSRLPEVYISHSAQYSVPSRSSLAFSRMAAHLKTNAVDLNKTPLRVGSILTLDPTTERFTGPNAEAATQLAPRKAREPFVLPDLG